MAIEISVTLTQIQTLDLSAAQALIDPLLTTATPDNLKTAEQQISFQINFPQDPNDPRELSEIPEVRLWFIYLDAQYPWLPFLLDWKAGELARYTAMLVPHQFHPKDGIQFNIEALEIFVMNKTFVLSKWCQQQGIKGRSHIQAMTQMLGYELEDGFFDLMNFQ
ncbi:MAG: CRR6 family NdhI maturation factor [Synechococcales bacterium]|nr:CRR6 family NdhI maturation factor [Synechococcales bacterium]